MQHKQDAVRDATERVQLFLDLNEGLLTAVDFTTARRWLDDVVTRFTEHAMRQGVGRSGAKGEAAKQLRLRRKLQREFMAPIAFIARRSLSHVPEFKLLQLPKCPRRREEFVAHARGIAGAAALYHETFVSHGLPSTFLNDFKVALAELDESSRNGATNRVTRIGATRGLAYAVKDGVAVLHVLDALVLRAASENEPLLRSWREARRIQRRSSSTTRSAPHAA